MPQNNEVYIQKSQAINDIIYFKMLEYVKYVITNEEKWLIYVQIMKVIENDHMN